jgi:hypothetical protein
MSHNSTDYPLEVNTQVDRIAEVYNENKTLLRKFQFIVKEYLVNTDKRGILLYHTPGMGKTVVASAITEYYRNNYPKKKIIIMLSKSLENNMRINILRFIKNERRLNGLSKLPDVMIHQIIEKNYSFISLNASNMYDQLNSISRGLNKEVNELDILLKGNNESTNVLDNSLLIIDEFHNLSNSIKNGSKNAVRLYKKIMNTRNIKMLFMTGTPIINHPFELVPAFNMLEGYLYENKKKHTLFPENEEEFKSFFIDHETKSIKNKKRFQNRIVGLVSYYGDFYFDQREGFPLQHELEVIKVPMSSYQFSRYLEIRDIELEEDSRYRQRTKTEAFAVSDRNSKGSYRIRSRQVSNYGIPEYALEFSRGRISVKKDINKIRDSDLIKLSTYSPKFRSILDNIKSQDGLGVVYSEFVSGEGLYLFAKVLEKVNGYVFWNESKSKYDKSFQDEFTTGEFTGSASTAREKTYAIISGSVNVSERQEIINVFNGKNNINGEEIGLLLISKSGAEGINLKNVRHLHIMEPFWNYARIEQIIARGSRYMSHDDLPEDQRDIKPYIYLSVFPKEYKPPDNGETITTDEELFTNSLLNKKLINEFTTALIETSIDCNVHKKTFDDKIQERYSCHSCIPTGDKLFNLDLYTEMQKKDNCIPISKGYKKIEAKELKMDIEGNEKTFYYTQETEDPGSIKVYTHDKKLNSYVLVKKSYPYYKKLVDAISTAEAPL